MKKLRKILEILKLKWLRETTLTILLIAIIIAIFVGINIGVNAWDPQDIDLTKEGLYSLTDESKQRIAELPEGDKFTIYLFDYEEEAAISDLVKQYTKVNENISVEFIKLDERPDLAQKYNVEQGYGTIVIEKGEKSKTFDSYDFSNYDYNTGKSTDITEQRFTNSLIALSSIRKNNTNICTYRT